MQDVDIRVGVRGEASACDEIEKGVVRGEQGSFGLEIQGAPDLSDLAGRQVGEVAIDDVLGAALEAILARGQGRRCPG